MPADVVTPTRPAESRAGDDALQLITDGLTQIAGWGVAVLGVVRGDHVEMVAVSGADDARADLLGARMPLAEVLTEASAGDTWGRFTFVAHAIAETGVREWEWVPDIQPVDHPDAWHPYDLLIATLCDDEGRPRGTLSIDIPPDGLRPQLDHQPLLETYAEQAERALLAALEREELAEQVRLADTARRLVRDALGQRSLTRILETCQGALMEGFAASRLWILTFDETRTVLANDGGDVHLPTELWAAVEKNAREAWHHDTVQVWTPAGELPLLATASASDVTDALEEHGVHCVLLVPLVTGDELLGALVLGRGEGARPWSEVETTAAVEIGRDLGAAVLTVRAFEREHQLVQRLQALDAHKSELIATVSHEQKTPLTAILGYLELLQSDESLPAHVRPQVSAMDRAAHRLSRVVEDLLVLAKVTDPDSPVDAHVVDLKAVAGDVVDLTSMVAHQRRVTISTEQPDGPVLTVGDPSELDRMMANLVSNAVKYSPEGGRVTIRLEQAQGVVRLEVRDEGLGISRAEQAKLFTEFFRSTNPAARAQPGTGLGLTIVARIVERHGGRIELESELGRGSTFRVLLAGSDRFPGRASDIGPR